MYVYATRIHTPTSISIGKMLLQTFKFINQTLIVTLSEYLVQNSSFLHIMIKKLKSKFNPKKQKTTQQQLHHSATIQIQPKHAHNTAKLPSTLTLSIPFPSIHHLAVLWEVVWIQDWKKVSYSIFVPHTGQKTKASQNIYSISPYHCQMDPICSLTKHFSF